MKITTYCALLFTVLGFLVQAAASPLDDKVAALKKAVNDELATRPASSNPAGSRNSEFADPRMVAVALDQFVAELDNPNMGSGGEMQLSQMLSLFTSDAVVKAKQDLIDEIHSERKARTDAIAAQIHDLLARVTDEVSKAKKPEDLDALLVDLQKFQGSRYGMNNPDTQALYQQVSNAFEFTKAWQNYLSHMATGQAQLANNDLQSLSQNNYAVGIIPRSHILELMTPTAQPGSPTPPATSTTGYDSSLDLLKSIKSLDEMRPTLEKIESMPSGGGMRPDTNILKQLIETYEAAKVGLPVDIGVNVKYLTQNGVTPELQRQLVAYVLQKYFATYKGEPPGADESLSVYVDRVTADAVSRLDWTLLKQTLNVKEFLDENSSMRYFNTRPSPGAINKVLTGINQEEAGQYMLAVETYQEALTELPENTIPPKFIGDKLAAIQKDHPKEYDQAMQTVTAPPPVRPMYLINSPGRTTGSPIYQGPYTPGMPVMAPTNSAPTAITSPSAPATPSK